MLDQNGERGNKVLLMTWDNSFDWYALLIIFCGAFGQTCIYLSIVLTFKLAHMAGLNIGIAQSIWAINPFFISILEKVVYGTPFNFKQGYGMLALMLCAICVSLSEVINPKEETAPVGGIVVEEPHEVPIWLAVLGSFGMPIICTLFVIVIKQANDTLKIAPYDFTMSYWLVQAIVF